MTCILVEDEAFAMKHLETFIGKVPFLELKSSFSDPLDALLYLQHNTVDLILLDISMPNYSIDGIEFIKIAGKQNYVLTTAFSDYALQSYDLNVIDFLLKPISFDRFLKSIQKVYSMIEKKENESDLFIYIKSEGKLQAINFSETYWIESERNNISIYTEQDRITSILTISEIESKLPQSYFSRIHKSYIIANNKVITIDKDFVSIRRKNAIKNIPIGETYKKQFYQVIDKKVLKKDLK